MNTGDKPEVVVVTGASAGVGRAVARLFGNQGARIGLLARGRDALEEARKEIEAAGGSALAAPGDIADPEYVEQAAAMVEEAFGPIDVWVNNAMNSVFAPFQDISEDDFRRVTEVTYLGYVYGTMAALRRMLPRDRGVIVQVGSALAYRAIPLQSAYCGAKHAIRGFTDSVRTELMHDGSNVHITMVQLPALNTTQFGWVKTTLPNNPQPVPPIYQPEVAARAVVWAAHNRRREVNVGAPTSLTILGNKLAPSLADRYLARTGYEGQQSNEPLDPNRQDNLWAPAPGAHGAHGTFDDQAHGSSAQFWLTTHRRLVALAGAGVATALVLLRRRVKR